jgi:hypothetical protein
MTNLSSLQIDIHKRRQDCGKRLQQTYGIFLDMIDCVLTNQVKVEHPYALSDAQLCDLDKKTKLFSLGAIGDRATIPGEKYIYRMVGQGHLSKYVRFKWPEIRNNPKQLWDTLMVRSNYGKDWLKLQEFTEGGPEHPYPGAGVNCWFDCTWWTTLPLDGDVILGGYTIGMFSEWIDNNTIIMRASIKEVESLGIAHVPTVIDGFPRPVFQPTEESSGPGSGITINLANYKKPAKGVEEFAVNPFKVKFIEIKPIELKSGDRDRRPDISKDDPEVLQSLLSYYDAL